MNGPESTRVSSTGVPNRMSSGKPARESSVTVVVRVRPFTATEQTNLVIQDNDTFFLGDGSFSTGLKGDEGPTRRSLISPRGVRKIINVVDDKMLIFDPPETNPLTKMQRNAFPNGLTSRIREHRFVFDRLFDVLATQDDVYCDTTRPLLDSVLDGYNATVFAYGATGCGKTHTILGTPSDPGVIFLTMKELYMKIEALADTKIFDINLSFLEIYNETIRDLLNPETHFKKLVLREDAANKISVSNLLSHNPTTVEEVMDLIQEGNKNRTCSPTEANATSSRSHAVLQINVVQKNRTADLHEEHTFATLSIIDLAGSERAAATKNRGARLNEGANINKSLLALGNCINALCDPRRRDHVPYRDSKLTRLLKFSLGGNCKTVMIVCVSPLSYHYDETLNTLKYANRAKEIKTKLTRNQHNLDRHVGSYLKMITEQKQEIEELRAREQHVVSNTIASQQAIRDKCLQLLLESISSIKTSLVKQNQEKWRKYFVLAKRKVILLQKIDVETLLSGLALALSDLMDIPKVQTMLNLCEQLLIKINTQISDLEAQYSRANEIDHIFNQSTPQILRKLKENEGWSGLYSIMFEDFVASTKESLERDVLFNSSILFDHLVNELRGFNFIPNELVNALSAHHNVHDGEQLVKLIENLILSLEELVNGEYDAAIERCVSSFIQEKFRELQELEIDNEDSYSEDSPSNGLKIHKLRDSKRGPLSPLRSSPPRPNKRSITKKQKQKVSPRRKTSKRVSWDVPKSDTTMLESDVSLDDFNSTIKSNLGDDSPIAKDILDQTLMGDDLELRFNPTLDSPPVPTITSDKISKSILTDLTRQRPGKPQYFSNRRLSTNLSTPINSNTSTSATPTTGSDNSNTTPSKNGSSRANSIGNNVTTPPNTGAIDNDSINTSRLPLLNKQASTKIIHATGTDESGPSFIPGPLSVASQSKMPSLMKATSVLNKFHGVETDVHRNIESAGSDKLD